MNLQGQKYGTIGMELVGAISGGRVFGAGNEVRTRDLNLGKVALYQLSYTRIKTRVLRSSCIIDQY